MSGLKPSDDVLQASQFTAVDGYVKNDDADLGDALNQFARPVEDQFQQNPDDVETTLTTAWKSIIAAGADEQWNWPKAQKLANFVLELQSRPDLEKDGQACQVQGMTVWKDLPTFGWQLRDAWNFGMHVAVAF